MYIYHKNGNFCNYVKRCLKTKKKRGIKPLACLSHHFFFSNSRIRLSNSQISLHVATTSHVAAINKTTTDNTNAINAICIASQNGKTKNDRNAVKASPVRIQIGFINFPQGYRIVYLFVGIAELPC